MAIKTFPSYGVPVVEDWNTYAANPALKYITAISINAVTTTVSNVFSSTYDNYRLEWSGVYCSNNPSTFPLISFTGGTGTEHFDAGKTVSSTGTNTYNSQNGTGYWLGAWTSGSVANASHITMDIYNPFNTVNTSYTGKFSFDQGGGFTGGVVKTTTSYTGFTITGLFLTNVVGTLRIYGYRRPRPYDDSGGLYNYNSDPYPFIYTYDNT